MGRVRAIAVLLALQALVFASFAAGAKAEQPEPILVPQVVGDWWQIAPNAPDVGRWSTGEENACDFTIHRDDLGTWHCISCIRGTSHFGRRLFYEWQSPELEKTDWEPVGMLEVPRGKRGRPPEFTSVQAPHAFKHGGRHYMFYNSAEGRCMVSPHGVNWQPHRSVEAKLEFFKMGRDVCVFHDEANERWIAYYCGNVQTEEGHKGAMVARIAPKPEGPWSEKEIPVRTTGNPESPFVLKHNGYYYLWQQMSCYRSADPLDFDNAELVAHMTGLWYNGKWAPEVLRHDGKWFIAGYGRGIHVAQMEWVEKTPQEIAAWREEWLAHLEKELRRAGKNRE